LATTVCVSTKVKLFPKKRGMPRMTKKKMHLNLETETEIEETAIMRRLEKKANQLRLRPESPESENQLRKLMKCAATSATLVTVALVRIASSNTPKESPSALPMKFAVTISVDDATTTTVNVNTKARLLFKKKEKRGQETAAAPLVNAMPFKMVTVNVVTIVPFLTAMMAKLPLLVPLRSVVTSKLAIASTTIADFPTILQPKMPSNRSKCRSVI